MRILHLANPKTIFCFILQTKSSRVFNSSLTASPLTDVGLASGLISVFLGWLLAMSASVYAGEVASAPPFLKNLSSIENRPLTRGYSTLTLSPIKKINGEWISERENLIDGESILQAFELSAPFGKSNSLDAFKHYYAQENALLLFKCSGFDCGSSNAWANERFNEKQLYGLDVSQSLFVWQLESPRAFDVVYLVQRGNRREYALWQRIIPEDQNLQFTQGAEIYSSLLNRGDAIKITGFSFSEESPVFDKTIVNNVAKALNEQPFRLFHVKVQAKSQTQASLILGELEKALVKAGVRKRRIKRIEDNVVVSQEQSPSIEISWP